MIKSAATVAVGKGMMVGSSPGRTEKLPAPGLARLLGGAGKSRGRGGAARSSPMFVTRSRSVGRLAEAEARAEEGEPSSPKVTCIGQVRIRNKNKKKRDTTTTTFKSKERRPTATATVVERCRCLQRPLLCGMFAGCTRGSGGRPWRSLWWRQWEFSLRSGKGRRYQQRRSIEKDADLMKPPIEMVGGGGGGGGGVFESDREEYKDDDDEEEKLENEEEDETRVFVSSATTPPPKNALLLMRCRSAPHNRASSLAANRFPVSPLPPSESKPSLAEKKTEAREDEEEKEGKNSSNGSSRDGGEGVEEVSRPLVLTRCKSEPARGAVVPEASYCFWANSGNGRSALVHDDRPPPPLLHR
ncbi:uncharacterized protein LOC120110328 [Phoenix dactylifera]|uniref:Uncharacterized protein LOC120110328 n=1 Tax=Phoenix dactylifera TaxID=42345 RepID=A0A8B9ACW5_PHODC|nr:uncharacterized protein LOC120110328 [Phoenix dactylifera]